MKTTTEWLEQLDGTTLYARATASHAVIEAIQSDCLPVGYQKISETAISWLYRNHPEAYHGFYMRVNEGRCCSVCSSEEHSDGDCLK